MIRATFRAALLGGSMFAIAGTAHAAPRAESVQETPVAVQAISAEQIEMKARLDALEALTKSQAQTIEQQGAIIRGLQEAQAAPPPTWKGAPQLADEDGWSFKPRGRLMFDVGHVNGPDGYSNDGLGFSNEVRRARIGAEGTIPGNFKYKVELDFAGSDVSFADAYLQYKTGDLKLTFGQHNNFQSLEELTSSLHTSFIERAGFTDAFGFERRVGVSGEYSKGPILLQAGVFTDSIEDLNDDGDDNNQISFDGRVVFMPKVGDNQLHFGASIHHTDFNDAASSVRYRQRPAIHTTDVRFINTGNIPADGDLGIGLEAAGIFGPFYAAGEAHWRRVDNPMGSNPTFFGGYIEGGYFFTGESRGYKGGKFDRVKVKNPFSKGGWGSWALNLRWDFLDLSDKGFIGGKQNAFQASVNWKPENYVLFGFNAALLEYDDAAILANGDDDYSVTVFGARAQVDF